jgi:formate--tetrahydrofolate ligase
LNRFASDTEAELQAVLDACGVLGVTASLAEVHAKGGEGGLDLADKVLDQLGRGGADFKPIYTLEQPITDKITTIAKEIYGADGVSFTPTARKDVQRLESIGLRDVPICMAKTQYSFSDDPAKRGRPRGFEITVREVTPSAGAGFVVAHTGDIMTMPGLPKRPAAEAMRVAADGTITGLF